MLNHLVQAIGFLLAGVCFLVALPLIVETAIVNPRPLLYFLAFLLPFRNISDFTVIDVRLWLALYLGARSILIQPTTRFFTWRIAVGLMVFVLVAEGSILIHSDLIPAIDVRGAQFGMLYLLGEIAFALSAARLLTSEEQVRQALVWNASGNVLIAIHALYQVYVGGLYQRVGSTFINANMLAAYMGLSTSILLQVHRSLQGRLRTATLVASGLCFTVTFLALSRAGISALLISILLLWATRDGVLRVGKMMLSVGVALLVAFAVVSYVRSVRVSVGSSESRTEVNLTAVSQAAEDYTRLEAAQYSLRLWSEYPWFGVGLGTFVAFNYKTNGIYVTTHNTFLQILVGTGIVGSLCVLFVGWGFWATLRPRAKLLFLPTLTCYLAGAFFGDHVEAIELIVVLILAYLFSFYHDRAYSAGFESNK
jgi:O-antigen ligase